METINSVLFCLLGMAAGYIGATTFREFVMSARMEQRRERRMMDLFDPNRDGSYSPYIGRRSERPVIMIQAVSRSRPPVRRRSLASSY